MSFSDILKSNFLENVTSVTALDIVLSMALAFAIGLFIFFVYKKTFQGVMYSSSFGVTLIALTMISTLVILAVTSNVVLSLGMVGALSIVRFRTAIKDPLDIAFLFWSIAAGIVLAAGMIPLAVFGSILIGVILLVFVNRKSHVSPYILVVTCEDHEAEKKAADFIKEQTTGLDIKTFAGFIRFQSVLKGMNAGKYQNLADAAAAGAYYDQAHFQKIFKRFAGMTPYSYEKLLKKIKGQSFFSWD